MGLRCGMIGLNRGKIFVKALAANEACDVIAVCDPDAKAFEDLSGLGTFTEIEPFLDVGLDVVAVISPGPVHAAQSIAAMERGVHVLTETPCVYSVDEARQVVETAARTGRRYMLAENFIWMGWVIALKQFIEEGKFGEIVYAEGDYTHDCRDLMFYDSQGGVPYSELDKHPGARPAWRATDLPPIFYCSHTLGPLLHLMDDRITSAFGLAVQDRGMPGLVPTDLVSALYKTEGGAVMRLTNGFSVAHPFTMYYNLVGTRGSAKLLQAKDLRVKFYSDLGPEKDGWEDLDLTWGSRPDGRSNVQVMVDEFIEAIVTDGPLPKDIHASLDMQLPGIVAHESAMVGGVMMDVPDSRGWG